ncbi:MAG: prephenate dehydrogenase/arogenate dehydrogenase family protein [Candidatus Omnitrophica bacterium]|nr:prephenate dehydrogenase/arogenate dehydrogenase family protein [Candidatus Omnitrophota bacterium]MDD5553571.1 prephenate dehydrogenase/arogenate dehydrogenase family protein [Candidatus Omnitrophota bacterium]
MRLFNKVAVIGTGLIGGSMALAIRKKGLAGEVVGVSRHKETLALAKKIGAIDKGSRELSIIRGADLVIFAAPVKTILSLADKARGFIPKEAIVTDVGSTKKQIAAKLEKIFPNYAGGHPLAGSEKRSIANINAEMFKDSLCILTPREKTSPGALRKIKRLWNALGAKVYMMSPGRHDEILSFVSHLPHAVAFSLAGSVPRKYMKFSASGLKDTTRVALSDPRLWTDIFLSNKRNMLKSIKAFEDNLSKIRSAIEKNDEGGLLEILLKEKKKRETLK